MKFSPKNLRNPSKKRFFLLYPQCYIITWFWEKSPIGNFGDSSILLRQSGNFVCFLKPDKPDYRKIKIKF